MRILPVLVLAAVLALVPAVGAQHEHMGTATAVIAHDTPANGRTYVGDLTSFAIVDDANHDLHPDVHQNNHIRVVLDNTTLWEASAAAGHDYDGVNTFSLVFPATGPYEVQLVDDMGMVVQHFGGTVEAANEPTTAAIDLQVPASATALDPAAFTVKVTGAGSALIDHSDVLFEVRMAGDLVFRTHAHSHTDAIQLNYAFPQAGTYTVTATGYYAYATGKHAEFAPVTIAKSVTVAAPSPTNVDLAPPFTSAPVPQNIVTDGTTNGGTYKLVGTYDPYTVGSPGTQMHLAALVMDPKTNTTVQHVDFKADLEGPMGTVFTSQSLHEYDGIYELVSKQPYPGSYTLTIDASMGNWTGHLEMPFNIALSPPLPDTSAPTPPPLVGPVTISGDLQGAIAGKAATMTLAAKDSAGSPYQHSEVDVQILDAKGALLLATKLHTHGDGLFPLTYAYPTAGTYTVRLAPSALDGMPINYAGALTAARDLSVTVGAGPGFPAAAILQPSSDSHAAPGVGLGILLVLGMAAMLARRT